MVKKLVMMMAGLFLSIGMAVAQSTVSGTVVSQEDGQPIIGASVKVVGTTTGTVTDLDGHFSLASVNKGAQLEISYIGMVTKIVRAENNMSITLETDQKTLDEVVVVAYGTAKRQSITGSVAVVDAKNIEGRIATSVTGALEGAAPGVQVNNSYGEPGAAPKIHIRGVGTLVKDADQPLYIVDGTAYEGNIAELNPNDIENMSVLKDASSAALYGNRAANGVVLITTKRAKYASKPSLSLKIDQGFYTRGIAEYDRLGADQWMESTWIAMKNYAMSGSMHLSETAAAAFATNHLISSFARKNIYNAADNALFDANGKLTASKNPYYNDLDWQDAVERTGYRQEYNLSSGVSGEKFNVYSSASYLKEKGYTINSQYERFTARINSRFNPTKWFELGLNLNGAIANRDFNESATGTFSGNPFNMARYMAPIYSYYAHNADGSFIYNADGSKQYDTSSSYLSNRNIAYEIRTDKDKNKRSVLDGQIYGKISLPYGFNFTTKTNFNHATNNRTRYSNPNIGDGASSNGRLNLYNFQYTTYTAQELLDWSHDFDVHHVDVLVGHENFSWKRKYDMVMNTNMAVPNNLTLGNFLNNATTEGYNDVYRTESYLTRIRYNYDERYFADFSYRRDGSSKFHKDHRWGDFFSFGLNWNMKRENFLKDVKWIDQLRTRLSYGEVGNDAGVGYYAYQSLYYIDKNGGNAALMKQTRGTENLKWETTQTVDFGIEGSLFNRLNFSIGYFDKRSKDLLFEVRMPSSLGAFFGDDKNMNPVISQNIGTISNRGFEISLNGDVIRDKDWTWNLAFDATTLKNKVIKLPGGKDILHGEQNYSEGHSAYEWYTYHFVGVDQMTGLSLYNLDPDKEATALANGALVEINGTKYTTSVSYSKREWAGTALPSVYGSFGSQLRWRDLSLSMLMTYSLGGKIYDDAYRALMSTASASSASALHKDVLKSWTAAPVGMTATSANRIDPNGIPLLDFNRSIDTNATSSRWLTSASYLVLKNITLTYRLPKPLVTSWGLGGMSVKAGIENLFTITSRKGLNPQFSFNGDSDNTYVSARVFSFGMALDF